jgi:hypothetical protein
MTSPPPRAGAADISIGKPPIQQLLALLSYLAFPWLAGHAWLYMSALLVSRQVTQIKLRRRRRREFNQRS